MDEKMLDETTALLERLDVLIAAAHQTQGGTLYYHLSRAQMELALAVGDIRASGHLTR